MADLAALRRADAAGLAGGVRRHVVVEHEAVGVLAHQRVDALLVAGGAERGDDDRLRLAAREERGPVRARQHAGANRDRTHGARVATVDPRLAGEDLVAHDLRLELEHEIVDLVRVARGRVGRDAFGGDLRVDVLQALLPRLLRAQLIGFAQRGVGHAGDLGDHRVVLRRGLPVPQRLAARFDQLVDHADGRLLLLVAEHDGAQHHFLGQLVRFRFHHQHGGFGARDDEVQRRRRELGLGRIEHVLAVDIADARGADRAVERNAREHERRRGADHRRNVRIDLRIDRHDGGDDLHFVVEAVREQRPDRAIDEPRGQRLLFRRAPFALEEAAGNLAGGVGLFLVVDGQRKEVLAGLGFLPGHRGDEHDGVVEARQHRAAGLAGDLAGFERQGVAAVGNRFLDGVHVVLNSASVCRNGRARSARPLAKWFRGTSRRGRRSHSRVLAKHRWFVSRDRRQTGKPARGTGRAYLRNPSFSISVR